MLQAVTPRMSGSRPKYSSVGYQIVLNRSLRGTFARAGSPSRSRNIKMRVMKKMLEYPAALMTQVMRRSVRSLADTCRMG